MNYKELWYPYRWGLWTRKKLLHFAKSYGTWIKMRRPIVVFLSALLDENHQETFGGTVHKSYKDV